LDWWKFTTSTAARLQHSQHLDPGRVPDRRQCDDRWLHYFRDGSQRVLVRAIGPSLANAGVTDPLGDPTLTLYDSQGTQLDFNDNWQDNPAKSEIEATTIPPPIQTNRPSCQLSRRAATPRSLGVRAALPTGTGLVEVYALPPVGRESCGDGL